MENQRHTSFLFVSLFLYLSTVSSEKEWLVGKDQRNGSEALKLLVFGDSYVDTGNWEKSSGSWHSPYGMTFPGKPTGRFSDGRVLTDFIASFFGVPSPQPYMWRKSVKKPLFQYGMNFAYGGTGVFNTMVNQPNMTSQIDLFQGLVKENFFTKQDLEFSVVLLSVAGNDYAAHVFRDGKEQDLPNFTGSLMNQLEVNIRRIHSLGVRKMAVTAVEPMDGPEAAARERRIKIPDLRSSHGLHFRTEDTRKHCSSLNPLKPCCVGSGKGYSCGSTDEKGAKKYEVCKNPELSFFWDTIHPSQSGWESVYSIIRPSLYELY
ncbi:GDSL esterase/lipase At5g03610-like isoform X3 [Punica granatum]|uniref:GDSL esterase/lipase At5g03610-like isoform X3 n=1 Tax=Punica granatum TaxID=22663 RepID=A0A6P8CBF5_PUNGR|nr:GDSL esterase/lipase At5g03610-like isoform X3 [Punica granatum]